MIIAHEAIQENQQQCIINVNLKMQLANKGQKASLYKILLNLRKLAIQLREYKNKLLKYYGP